MEINIIKIIQSARTPFDDIFFKIISALFGLIGFIFILICFLLFAKKAYAIFLGIGYGIFWFLLEIAKLIIKRPRPYQASMDVIALSQGSNYSMPSGHSFSVAYLSVMICYYIFKTTNKIYLKVISIIFAVILCVLTAFSRMYLGMHYISDVCVGLIWGIISGLVTLVFYNKVMLNSKKLISRE